MFESNSVFIAVGLIRDGGDGVKPLISYRTIRANRTLSEFEEDES